jgi:hypothetical protein
MIILIFFKLYHYIYYIKSNKDILIYTLSENTYNKIKFNNDNLNILCDKVIKNITGCKYIV